MAFWDMREQGEHGVPAPSRHEIDFEREPVDQAQRILFDVRTSTPGQYGRFLSCRLADQSLRPLGFILLKPEQPLFRWPGELAFMGWRWPVSPF